MLFRSIWLTGLILTISGCQGLTTLPDGQKSFMNDEANQIRSLLNITPAPLKAPLVYKSIKNCQYKLAYKSIDNVQYERSITLSITPLEEYLRVVTHSDNDEKSHHLISKRGRIIDFISNDFSSTEKIYSENYDEYASHKLEEIEKSKHSNKPGLHIVNRFSVLIPEFSNYTPGVGNPVAVVRSENGDSWGEYIYRGVTIFRGIRVGVLDLVRTPEKNSGIGPYLVGFSIVDFETTLPVYVVFDSGTMYVLDRTICFR